jgi:molybdopterin converting factor small subunit
MIELNLMNVRVRLLGMLSRDVKSYDPKTGLELEMPEGATCRDIATVLDLPAGRAGMFSIDGILKKPDDPLADGDEVNVFMPLAGG